MSRLPALMGILSLLVMAGAAPSLAHERDLDQAVIGGTGSSLVVPASSAAPSPSPTTGSAALPALTSPAPSVAVSPPPWETAAPSPQATPSASTTPKPTPRPSYGPWHLERRITFYGPGGHYGRRTACGQVLTTKLVGVATYMYPCGTKIQFTYKGRTIIAPVVDRGPARWTGFRFDLTGRACVNLVGSRGACWTIHNVKWRVVSTR